MQVYVQDFPDKHGKWQVSTEGGTNPVWSRDGRELFYVSNRKIMAVAVASAGGTLTLGKPQILADPPASASSAFEVSPDGKRFLITVPSTQSQDRSRDSLTLIQNWQSALGRF